MRRWPLTKLIKMDHFYCSSHSVHSLINQHVTVQKHRFIVTFMKVSTSYQLQKSVESTSIVSPSNNRETEILLSSTIPSMLLKCWYEREQVARLLVRLIRNPDLLFNSNNKSSSVQSRTRTRHWKIHETLRKNKRVSVSFKKRSCVQRTEATDTWPYNSANHLFSHPYTTTQPTSRSPETIRKNTQKKIFFEHVLTTMTHPKNLKKNPLYLLDGRGFPNISQFVPPTFHALSDGT
jgi:hypothetical protein